MEFSWTTAITGAFVFNVLFFWRWWRQRHDVWITMHDAYRFEAGDVVAATGTAGPTTQRLRVIKVARRSLLVRPIK